MKNSQEKLKINLKKFRMMGYDVIDLITRDYDASNDIYKFLIVPSKVNHYSNLFFSLTNKRLPENLSLKAMEEIYKHKWLESEKVKKDIGLKNAALDWYHKHFDKWLQAQRTQSKKK